MRLDAHIMSPGLLFRMAQQRVVISGTSSSAVHLGQQHELRRICGSMGQPCSCYQLPIARARVGFAFVPARAAGDRDLEAAPGQPIQAGDGFRPGACPALGFMQSLAVVVEADAQRQPRTEGVG